MGEKVPDYDFMGDSSDRQPHLPGDHGPLCNQCLAEGRRWETASG